MGADFYMEDHEEDHNRVERVEKLISKWRNMYAPRTLSRMASNQCADDLEEAFKASWEVEDEKDE